MLRWKSLGQTAHWKSLVGRHMRWSSPIAQGLVLCLVTFGFVLPLFCNRLLYSYYFIKPFYLDSMSENVLQESYQRGQEALKFWQDLGSAATPAFGDATSRPDLLVTVVTARRNEGGESHYLLQVMQRLTALLSNCRGRRRCPEVLVCDVESGTAGNEDASLLERRFRVVRRTPEERWQARGYVNTFEKEKRDYVYCLRRGWDLLKPRNVVVLEDDALPEGDFFPVIGDLLARRFARDTLYVKLYHPERLQRYWNPEPYRIMEWVGLGLVGSTTLLLALSRCASLALAPPSPTAMHMFFFTLYVMAAAELLGRHYLLEARRLSPQLYAVAPATECCTPGMLYPGNASLRAAEYLEQTVCYQGNAKDTVLYRMARTVGRERAHSLEPNLITHIGAYSSVRANPYRPKLL